MSDSNTLALLRSETELVPNGEQYPWGMSSDRRGKAGLTIALEFQKWFPVGSTLDNKMLDEWAVVQGLIPSIPDRDSVEWAAHRVHRLAFVKRINSGALHTRMTENGGEPYCLDAVSRDLWEVRSPVESALAKVFPKRISRYTVTQREQFKRRMEAMGLDMTTETLRLAAEMMLDELGDAAEDAGRREARALRRYVKVLEREKMRRVTEQRE